LGVGAEGLGVRLAGWGLRGQGLEDVCGHCRNSSLRLSYHLCLCKLKRVLTGPRPPSVQRRERVSN
jgi:hypothetical protein